MRILTILLLLALHSFCSAQVVTIDPAFPNRSDMITVTFDATQGNSGLVGEEQVYMHTGTITENSANGSDWKYVVGNWGTDDARVRMTNIGNDKHQLSYVIEDFYGVPGDEIIEQLSFVFRNVDGSREGKTATGGDIFIDIFEGNTGLVAFFQTPTAKTTFQSVGDVVPVSVVSSTATADLVLQVDGVEVAAVQGSELDYDLSITSEGTVQLTFLVTADGLEVRDTAFVIVAPDAPVVPLPAGAQQGITRLDEQTIRCVLAAPGKSNGYVVGSFNDYAPSEDYFMNITPDGDYLWADVSGVAADEDHILRYLIDGNLSIADPYSELVVDSNNDRFIMSSVFPEIADLENPFFGYSTWLRPEMDYQWEHEQPVLANDELVVYELLVRDFVEDRSYQEILDTIDYLAGLGITAVEFMPVSEFEGNESWGYNPSFHMALDKYYGTPEKFKELVDAFHSKGIAVLLDVVYNHAFSQSPLAQLWWDAGSFRPTEDSPYLNVVEKHPFNVGYDFNHESTFTKNFVKQTLKYWIEEYKIDGFRFDLSKGFTQVESNGNVGAWGNYDASRIAILKDYADYIWSVDSDNKIILEHFGDNQEEKELAEYGMMLWSNQGHTVNEATMGFNDNSNFEWIDYKFRGWDVANAVNYIESHDEERLMHRNLNFGRETSNYSIRDLETALRRNEAAAAFLYTVPGPKMLWQFGEAGYDYSINWCTDGSINENCRLTPKPIRWDYLEDINRKRLVDVTSALIKLKTEYKLTQDLDYSYNLNGDVKLLRLVKEDLDGLVIANFGLSDRTSTPVWPTVGIYYDYLSGETLEVTSPFQPVELAAGEYHVYLTQNLGQPVISSVEDVEGLIYDYTLYPNPATDAVQIEIDLQKGGAVALELVNTQGQVVVNQPMSTTAGANLLSVDVSQVPTGIYHIVLRASAYSVTDRVFIRR